MFRLTSPHSGGRYNWRLTPGSYVTGRDPQVDLVVNDSTVSRRHARIVVVDENTVRLTDLGSLNGTQVNDNKVTDTVEVKAGDTLSFGNVGFVLLHEDLAPTRPASTPPVSVISGVGEHTSISAIPLEEALAPPVHQDPSSQNVFRAISDMAKMLILPQSLGEMFDQALDLLQQIVTLERCAILMTKEGVEEVELMSYRVGKGNGSSDDNFTMSSSILSEVLRKKNAVFFSDLISDDRFSQQESIVVQGIRSAMVVPMTDEDRVIGVLYIDTTDPGHRYNEDTLKVAATFGNILAAKITIHHLLKERQEKQQLESELTIASQIQSGLMPKELPQVEGYHFHAYQMQCKMVGGDLYDVAKLNDGRILFLLADVSGKGMGAALLASNILSALRILRGNEEFRILDSVKRISSQLHHSSRSGDFATVFAGILDPSDNTVRFVNAGHNPPLLVKTDGSLKHLDPTGIPIGIFEEFDWKEESIQLEPGDKLVVFTDGITEATDSKGELYDDDRMENFVKTNCAMTLVDLTSNLLTDVNKFVGDAPRSDDMTMILLERNV